MGTYHSRIDHEVFHVSIVHKMLMHPLPDALVRPTGKSFVDAIPLAVLAGQQSPLCAAASHPKDSFDETLTVDLLSNIDIWARTEELMNL